VAGLAVVAIATAFAFVVQRSISRPLLRLTDVARKIARYEDYSVRATKVSDDEIGFLAETFNAMLTEIERRQRQAQWHALRFAGRSAPPDERPAFVCPQQDERVRGQVCAHCE